MTQMSPSAWGIAARTAAPLPRFSWRTRTMLSRPLAPTLDEVAGAVGRAVVNDDDLFLEVESGNAVEDLDDGCRLVVGGHQE